jgi:thiomorpholine-carboxylate dehydrogenase
MVRYLDEASVRAVLRWDPLIAAMESALAAFSSGQVIQPVRNMLTIEEGKRYLGIMPAVMQEAMGVKLVSFYPGNAGTGLPTHFGIILLSRSDTGEPLAVMDGRLITEMRTAAVSAAVTKHLAAPESHVLALLGSGVQASAHWNALLLYCGSANLTTYAYGVESRSTLSASPTSMTSEQERAWSQRYEMRT